MNTPSHPIPTIKTVCAWCQTLLSGDAESDTVSHGICPACRETFFTRKPMAGLAEGSQWNPEPKPELN